MFGVVQLAAFASSPAFAHWGHHIGPARLCVLGSAAQTLSGGLLFGFLGMTTSKGWFLGLSYALR